MTRPDLADVHLMLVGAGPALQTVQEQADALRVGDRVHTMGEVEPSRLCEYVCAFDAALIPAINSYASPLKMFASLAAGVITLAPDQPNLRERIDDGRNGILFTPDSAASLGDKLAAVVADRAGARQIGLAGQRDLIERRWTWAGNAQRVVETFEGLVQ